MACIYGSYDCLQILIGCVVDVNSLKRGDWTPLMISVSKVNLKISKLLLENGAKVDICNKDGWNVFHIAARTGNVNLLCLLEEYFISKGEEKLWNSKSNNGRTLLHIAAIHGHLDVMKFLIKKLGSDAVFCKDFCGVSPFMNAAQINSLEICRLIYMINPTNIDVNDADNSGRSSLHLAAQTNSTDIIRFLVCDCHCNIDFQDSWKQTPLFLAVREGHFESTKLLLELGAKQLEDFKCRNPRYIALQYKHNHLLELFCEKNSDKCTGLVHVLS